MKRELLAPLFVGALLGACKPERSTQTKSLFSPLQNGFGVVVQPIGIDSGPGAKLYYKGTNETPVLVWPYIGTHGYPILYSNDVALLLADKPDTEGRLVITALIAVQREGPAMDISKDLLLPYAARTNANSSTTLGFYSPLRLQQSDGKISVTYLQWTEPPGLPESLTFPITWDQIFSIMEDVKRTGKTNKVTNTGVLYLQKDYSDTFR